MRTTRTRKLCGAVAVAATAAALAALASPASAHHSFAMFDRSKQVTLNGRIKEFQWTNPHSWIQVMVKQPDGKEVEWSIEGASPNSLARNGWTRKSLQAGDQVELVMNPAKDGSSEGALVRVSVGGKVIGAQAAAN